LIGGVLLGLMGAPAPGAAAPLPGQIIVDPQNPAWLKYNCGGPFFMCGPGDPEGFLYRGGRRADGTRDGDQMSLINKLKRTGANSIYMMAVRSHGGDGDSTENPFVDNDPAKGINPSVLDQWETWFTELDNNGIVIFFFLYDDARTLNHSLWKTGNKVGEAEHRFIETLVNRFEHHRNLIWVVKEEYREGFSRKRVSRIAKLIRGADNHGHVIAVHQNHGLVFDFADDPNVDQFAIQYNKGTADKLHKGIVTAWNNASGRYNLNMSEAARHGMGQTARKQNWAVAMGGAYVMVLGWDIANTRTSDLEDCGRLVGFMESTNFSEMSPHDELKFGGTEYVLALPGNSYIAYASTLSSDIGLKKMSAGTYDFKWYDVTNGTTLLRTDVSVRDGNQTWSKPAGIGNELAVYIKRTREHARGSRTTLGVTH